MRPLLRDNSLALVLFTLFFVFLVLRSTSRRCCCTPGARRSPSPSTTPTPRRARTEALRRIRYDGGALNEALNASNSGWSRRQSELGVSKFRAKP